MDAPNTNSYNNNNNNNMMSVEIGMEVHRVEAPPRRSTIQKLKTRLKETFFPDDPLRQFKGQTLGKKWILGAQYVFPILKWGPEYNLKLFKSDIVSGLTIASLAIPQGISYAKLANLPPIVGLYSSFVPPLVYAVLGSSRDLAVGPVSIASLVMGSMLRQQVSPTADPLLFLHLAFSSTFFAGLFQASLGFLRLGFIIDFLSKATLVGFMAGAAIIVSLQQLKSLLGITHFTKKMGLVPVMSSVFHNTNEWSWQTILMGICFLVFLLITRHVSMKKPKLFWVSAGAPLLSVILSTLFVFAFKAQKHGVSVIGKLNEGLNPPSWNQLNFHGSYLGLVMKTGLITGILSLTEGIAVGRTFAALKNYQVDGNKEMIAIGLMNVVGSSTSCYVTTGAFSRSAVNHNAGAKTAVSNIIMSFTVMVTLLFLMPLFQYTPNVVLGAIIVTAVVGLIDIPAAYEIWKIDKFDFLVMLCAFLGVIFISVQEGLAIAVGISIFKVLLQITRPKIVMLGNIPGSHIFRNLHQYKEAVRVPGFLILSIEAPINFANITYLNDRISRWIEDYEAEESQKHSELGFVVLDLSAVSAIDTSGVSFFKDLRRVLDKKSLELVLVNPIGEVMEKLQRSGETRDFMRPDFLFLTVGEAVASLMSTDKNNHVANLGTGVDLPYRIAVHPGGEGLVCSMPKSCRWFEWDAAERNGVHGWGLKSSMKVLDQLEDVGQQLALTFDDEGSVLAVGGEDGKLRVFKWPSMDTILDESNAHTSVKDLAFSPDGKFLSSVGTDGPIRVWNVALAMPIAALQREKDERFGFSRFSPNNDKHQVLYVMAMQGKGGSIVKWNTTSWTRINSKHIVRDSITAFNVSADGKRLVVGTIEGDILILNSVSMRVQTVVKKAHLGIVTALKFSHDSRALLSASFDSSARVTLMNDEKQSGWSLWVILFIILLGLGLGLGLGLALYYAESEGLFHSKLQLFVNKM